MKDSPFLKEILDLKAYVVFIILFILGIVLYYPVLHKSFAADDFMVLHRAGASNDIFIKGFFRPLSDFTIYISYKLFGVSVFYYNIFNLLVHICCGFMLFCFSRQLIHSATNKNSLAFISAVLFVSYPFHNESVVWIVGRGSSMAAFFAIACLWATSYFKNKARIIFSCLFYFIGLAAYESIFPVPLMVLILVWIKERNMNECLKWMGGFSVTLLLHFALRLWLSGYILGDYAGKFFHSSPLVYISRSVKTVGRLFLPPMENSTVLVYLFIVIASAIFGSIIVLLKRKNVPFEAKAQTVIILFFLATTLIVPFVFSVSTRTSESDRLLYFPSIFLCILVSHLLLQLVSRKWLRLAAVLLLAGYNIYFLHLNNQNWLRASEITNSIIENARVLSKADKQTLLVNIPEDINGAFIFRNGFNDALMIYGVDTGKIKVIHFLGGEEGKKRPFIIVPVHKNEALHIPPGVLFTKGAKTGDYHFEIGGTKSVPFNLATHQVWYWNKREMRQASLY